MRSLTGRPYRGPTWEPVGPMFTAADTELASIYWPWLIDMLTVDPAWTGPRWRLYYSTDHDQGAGGIAYSTAGALVGPWTHHPVIYTDTALGFSTETPSVVFVPETGLWHLYYQQAGTAEGGQRTMLAVSPDGLTAWTRVGIAISVPAGSLDWPGWEIHTGYMVPHRLPGGRWLAYHLLGGGNWPEFAQSWSDDGRTWMTDARPLGYGSHLTHGAGDRRVEWNSGYLLETDHGLWWVGTLADWTSGTSVRSCFIAQAPIAADYRTLLAAPVPILGGPAPYRAINVSTDADDQTWLVSQDADAFGLAAAVTP
jgi:hypothetical protein